MSSRSLVGIVVAGALTLGGCHSSAVPASAPTPSAVNSLSAAEQRAGWRLLFDGRTTTGWRGYRSDTMPTAWHVVDGVLTKSTGTDDIVTRTTFQDFELRFDWKIGTGGNSGVFYRASEEYDHVYWTGPEYQLLDDANAGDGKNRLTSAGAAYGLYPSPAGIVKPANEWNTSRIVVRGHHVEHWMNGQKLLAYELESPDWAAKVAASKFAVWPDYGKLAKGFIAIQGDHNGTLALRNIMIRELK
ncbi:MAG: 3-keto-disaccharide hydrolase [Gemmatimonadales bacterium]